MVCMGWGGVVWWGWCVRASRLEGSERSSWAWMREERKEERRNRDVWLKPEGWGACLGRWSTKVLLHSEWAARLMHCNIQEGGTFGCWPAVRTHLPSLPTYLAAATGDWVRISVCARAHTHSERCTFSPSGEPRLCSLKTSSSLRRWRGGGRTCSWWTTSILLQYMAATKSARGLEETCFLEVVNITKTIPYTILLSQWTKVYTVSVVLFLLS